MHPEAPQDYLRALRTQMNDTRQFCSEAKMASIWRQIGTDLVAARAAQSNIPAVTTQLGNELVASGQTGLRALIHRTVWTRFSYPSHRIPHDQSYLSSPKRRE